MPAPPATTDPPTAPDRERQGHCWHLPSTFLLLAGLCLLACSLPTAEEGSGSGPALEDIAGAVLGLFEEADLVCLGETHGSSHDHALRLALLRHPHFATTVDTVVVEFANPIHHETLDSLLLRGQRPARAELESIRADAGLGLVWLLPIYGDFFEELAARNAELPAERRIPVRAAALPIDWTAIRTPADLVTFPPRLDHFERVLRRQLALPDHKTLAIFGTGHCERRPPSLLSRLLTDHPDRIRAVFGFEPGKGVATARETFGLAEAPAFVPIRHTASVLWPSSSLFFEGHGLAGVAIGELVDAAIYYGRSDDHLLDPTELELGPDLEAELNRRAGLWARVAGLRSGP